MRCTTEHTPMLSSYNLIRFAVNQNTSNHLYVEMSKIPTENKICLNRQTQKLEIIIKFRPALLFLNNSFSHSLQQIECIHSDIANKAF